MNPRLLDNNPIVFLGRIALCSSLRALPNTMMVQSAAVCRVCSFCLIFVPFGHYDEPEILPYAIRLICPIGADVRHLASRKIVWGMALFIVAFQTRFERSQANE
jgi:hypothetical protein